MKAAWCVTGSAILTFLTICDGHLIMKDGIVGIGVDLSKLGIGGDKCPPNANITCSCGLSGSPVIIVVPVCSRAHRWKVRCRPCNNETPEELCPRYSSCAQCHIDGGNGCVSCPNGKFGTWCENDCNCVNGGLCERDGRCTCVEGFVGRNCEIKKGCPPPAPPSPPLQVVYTPQDRPLSAVYSCPSDYELRGHAVLTCEFLNNRWSSDPPICRPKCPLLSVPANGQLQFSGSELVEGVTATITCSRNHKLVGQKNLVCLDGGRWSDELPVCEALASCPDPGMVRNAERTVLPGAVKMGAHFAQDSSIEYTCQPGFEQMGNNTIICRLDGTWSSKLPFCIRVSTVVLDCLTKGSEIMPEEGASVRIVCPPECTYEDFQVWGTSIYRAGSSVCQAAIHSAKITNSGGPVAVINNGPYTYFTGSTSNNIQSESYSDRDDSFRFDKLPPLVQSKDAKECEEGLIKLENLCAYVSNLLRTKSEAEAVCNNMGLQLELPTDTEERKKLLTALNDRKIHSIWAGPGTKVPEPINDSYPEDTETHEEKLCSVGTVAEMELQEDLQSCNQLFHYVCIRKSGARNLAICQDPGPLANGKVEPVGLIDGVYYVGSSIKYSCEPLHYLRGAKSISCSAKGSWSNEKPTCVKVDACVDPPVPIGGFVTYLPPLKTVTAQRSATHRGTMVGSRAARLPVGLAAPLPQELPTMTTTPEPESIPLPPGVHRLGSRALYDCESRYYKLIGSRTRRCQEQGEWSGRPPSCIPICGRSDSPRSPFIVNGNATDIGQWPWQAGIARYLPDFNRWFLLCGASLLNERWLITAAHCVTFAGTTLPIEPDKFQVYLGKYHRSDSKDDDYVQVRKIHEIHIHPDFDPGLFDADIALIQLASPVHLNSRVQPVCLPTEQTSRDNLVDGKRGVVTGWGMNENETYSETLQQAVLPVVSHARCEKGYEDSELPLTVTENMFCAGYAQGRSDACSGDSGGPMVFTDDSSKERKWVLEGIVSWGSPRGCGNPNQYGGFTSVSRFLDWIHLFF